MTPRPTNLVTCPYCKNFAELVNGDVVYPSRPHLRKTLYWICKRCDAISQCKHGSTTPRSPLANTEERKRRQAWFAAKHAK